MTAEEHLRADIGTIFGSQLFQLALLKAENDRLKAELAQLKESPNGTVPTGSGQATASVSE